MLYKRFRHNALVPLAVGMQMLEKAGSIIAGIFGLALISTIALTAHFVNYSIVPPVDLKRSSLALPPSVPQPWVPRLTAPRAVLVLDVSGSMGITRNPSDPERLQAVAALQFFDTYLKMSHEVLEPGDKAQVAMVLFGTVAQVVDWDGKGARFLDVSEGNRALYERVIVHYLGLPSAWGGSQGEDPRRAKDTDYAAALDVVEALVAGSPSPPAIVFMTDGKPSPHPCYTPPGAAGSWTRRPACGDLESIPTLLSATALPTVFIREAGQGSSQAFAAVDTAALAAGIMDRMARLSGLRFPVSAYGAAATSSDGPVAWFPIFLDVNARSEDLAAVNRMLGGAAANREHWGSTEGVIHCRTAGDMVGQYVTALARWLRMVELPLTAGTTRFQIPAQTQAIAIQIESDGPLTSLHLARGELRVPLTGRGRFWGGVVTADCSGEWTIVPESGAVRAAKVFIRPRFDWVLSAPAVCIDDSTMSPPQAHLYLCRTADGAVVAGPSVFADLPESLPGSLVMQDGTRRPFRFQLAPSVESGPSPTYTADMQLDGTPEGSGTIIVELGELRRRQVPLRTVELTRLVEVAASARLVLRDSRNRRLGGIELVRVPSAPDWAQGLRAAPR